jgi:FlaA1/EpsC-like NDP-sugar epimerase
MNIIKKLYQFVLRRTALKRRLFFFTADIIIISFSMYAAFWLRYNGVLPPNSTQPLLYYISLALIIKLSFLVLFNLYDISWRFVSMEELIKIFKALSVSSLFLGMALFFLRVYAPFKAFPFPRSTLLIDYIISLFLTGSLRISKRLILEGNQSSDLWCRRCWGTDNS